MFVAKIPGGLFKYAQIPDYTSGLRQVKISVKEAKKLFGLRRRIQKKRKRLNKVIAIVQAIIAGVQTTLLELVDKKVRRALDLMRNGIQRLTVREPIFRMQVPAMRVLSEDEARLYQLRTYNGTLEHLFFLTGFDELVEEICTGIPSKYLIASLFRVHVAMVKLKSRSYSDCVRDLYRFPELAKACSMDGEIPTRKVVSRLIDKIGIGAVRALEGVLVERCLDLGLIDFVRVAGDGSLIRAYCNPFKKEDGRYLDPEAGIYIRGNRILGVGFNAISAVSSPFGLPFEVISTSGNRHEGPFVVRLLKLVNQKFKCRPRSFAYDKAGDSAVNNAYAITTGTIPALCAKAGLGERVKVTEYFSVREEYLILPEDETGRIARFRTAPERLNAQVKTGATGYGRDRMIGYGLLDAEFYVRMVHITMLLTAIAAYMVGRRDLVRSVNGFSEFSSHARCTTIVN